jgi:hypothetical protein
VNHFGFDAFVFFAHKDSLFLNDIPQMNGLILLQTTE